MISGEQLKRHIEGAVRSLVLIEDPTVRTVAILKAQMELAALTGQESFEFILPLVERVRANPQLLPPTKKEDPGHA